MAPVHHRVRLLALTIVVVVVAMATRASHAFTTDFASPFGWCESSHKPRPFAGPAPSVPELPDQYSLKVEANILEKDWSTELEEHYDWPNQRASLALTFNGTTTRTIYNFKAGERYDIYPNGSCSTRPAQVNFFGYISTDHSNGRPVMATVNEMMRLTDRFNLTYVGQTAVRGIKVNHWTSCQGWQQVGARFQLDYYFTHPDYQPATGQVTKEMPLRIVLNGTAGNINMKNVPMGGRHRFDHFYDFTSIRVGPPRDMTVFEVPPGVVCQGRGDQKVMPTLPDVFQMSMEVTMPGVPLPPKPQTLLYDYQHRMVETRRTAKVHTKRPSLSGPDPDDMAQVNVHVIEDYSTGLKYIVSQEDFKCSIEPMADSRGVLPVMAHGEALLKIAHGQKSRYTDFTYQGVSTLRDMKVEVWGYEANGVTQQIFFLATPPPRSSMLHGQTAGNQAQQTGSKPPASGQWPGHQPPDTNNSPWMIQSNSSNSRSSGQNSQPSRPPRLARNDGDGSALTQGTPPKRPSQAGNDGDSYFSNSTKPQRPRPTAAGWLSRSDRNKRQTTNTGSRSSSDFQSWPSSQQQQQPSLGSHTSTLTAASGKSNAESSMAKTNHNPIMIGLFFRNKTAVDQRNLPAFFRQVMSEKIMAWMNSQVGSFKKDDNDDALDISDQISWGLNMEKSMGNHHGEAMIHVYDFTSEHALVDHFQVSPCFDAEQRSQVMLIVRTPFKENVLNRMPDFVNSVRRAVAEAVGVSLLAVSNLVAMPFKNPAYKMDATSVTFTLLGSPAVQGGTALGVKSMTSIQEAKSKLQKAIANGIGFSVTDLSSTKSFLVDQSLYMMDYEQETLMASSSSNENNNGNKASPNTNDNIAGAHAFGGQEPGASQDGNSETSGYSSGEVAGIAIATMGLGFLIAVVAVAAVVIYKRRQGSMPMIPFNREV